MLFSKFLLKKCKIQMTILRGTLGISVLSWYAVDVSLMVSILQP